MEESFNTQNNRVYARSSREESQLIPRLERGHYSAIVMVWYGGVVRWHLQVPFFRERSENIGKVYQLTVLEPIVKHLNQSIFGNKPWTFQQDEAHKVKTSHLWLKNNFRDFIATENWPAISPNLNPFVYMWYVLEGIAFTTWHPNIELLKRALARADENFPTQEVRLAIDEWLKSCWKAIGIHFE